MAGPDMNVFRVLADVSHTISKLILVWAIHSNKSAEGVSLLTQLLYIVVFSTRYLDVFWVNPSYSWWNFVLKIFYILSSLYIVFLMMRVYARTREREKAWKMSTWLLGGCLISAPLVCLIFEGWGRWTFAENLWTFSIELEAFCVLPQLLLLRQTTVPTVIDSYYLVLLGSYRFFYILNWIYRAAEPVPDGERKQWPSAISVIFGIIQTGLYIDFAWVYYTRQRVKLRGGGVVDSDDLSKSYLVRRFIGNRGGANANNEDDDADDDTSALARQEDGVIHAPQPRSGRTWGPRGISVSADDTLMQHDQRGSTANMADPSQFEDDDFDEDADAPPPPAPAKDDKYKPRSPAGQGEDGSDEESSAGQWQENTNGSANR